MEHINTQTSKHACTNIYIHALTILPDTLAIKALREGGRRPEQWVWGQPELHSKMLAQKIMSSGRGVWLWRHHWRLWRSLSWIKISESESTIIFLYIKNMGFILQCQREVTEVCNRMAISFLHCLLWFCDIFHLDIYLWDRSSIHVFIYDIYVGGISIFLSWILLVCTQSLWLVIPMTCLYLWTSASAQHRLLHMTPCFQDAPLLSP